METSVKKSQHIKIYTNESVQVVIAEGLKRRGVDARSCRDVENYGMTDEQQLDYAARKVLSSSRTMMIFSNSAQGIWPRERHTRELFMPIRKIIASENVSDA